MIALTFKDQKLQVFEIAKTLKWKSALTQALFSRFSYISNARNSADIQHFKLKLCQFTSLDVFFYMVKTDFEKKTFNVLILSLLLVFHMVNSWLISYLTLEKPERDEWDELKKGTLKNLYIILWSSSVEGRAVWSHFPIYFFCQNPIPIPPF